MIEKPLPKPIVDTPVAKDAVTTFADLQKFLDPPNHKKQALLMSDRLATKKLQEDVWTTDPLRLCLEEKVTDISQDTHLDRPFPFQQEFDLPYEFKMKSTAMYHRLVAHLYVPIEPNTEYHILASELPYSAASLFAPTPPLKDLTSTPSISPPTILPFESYASVYAEPDTWNSRDPLHTWLYESSTNTPVDEEGKWESIFQPHSTFQYHKGSYGNQSMPNLNDSTEATLPQLMPTPPLKPSPVLTIPGMDSQRVMPDCDSGVFPRSTAAFDSQTFSRCDSQAFGRCDSQATMLNHDHYDMLQQIRGHSAPVSPSFKEDPEMKPKHSYWTEKRMFWLGFVFPCVWFVGSIRKAHDLKWQKRCRLAALYFTLAICVVILVLAVKSAGTAAIRQSQTDTIRAVIAN